MRNVLMTLLPRDDLVSLRAETAVIPELRSLVNLPLNGEQRVKWQTPQDIITAQVCRRVGFDPSQDAKVIGSPRGTKECPPVFHCLRVPSPRHFCNNDAGQLSSLTFYSLHKCPYIFNV